MSCLGVHFAISEAEVETLREFDDEQDRISHVQEVIEEKYFANHKDLLAQSDKAWDAIHRVLADGELTCDGGDYPLNHVILAGELLYTESDYIMSLKNPGQVKDIAAALAPLTAEDFRGRYFSIDPETYGMDLSEEDLTYTWDWFQSVREFYIRAAAEGRYVLFTADQ
jgi:hypothetical protein